MKYIIIVRKNVVGDIRMSASGHDWGKEEIAPGLDSNWVNTAHVKTPLIIMHLNCKMQLNCKII